MFLLRFLITIDGRSKHVAHAEGKIYIFHDFEFATVRDLNKFNIQIILLI